MQNKGAVRIFAIALALVCLYQLSFTWFSSRVEHRAAEYAKRAVVGITDPIEQEKALKQAENTYLDSMATETSTTSSGFESIAITTARSGRSTSGSTLKAG